jgi:DNA-binding Lrp family transcriptional regulator
MRILEYMLPQKSRWNFFTNHARILIYLEAHPDHTLRRVALAIGITERAVQRIVAELEEGGYLKRAKVGRQNKYEINVDTPLRHSQESHRSVKELLDWVKPSAVNVKDEYNPLDNWTVGEHGSEV